LGFLVASPLASLALNASTDVFCLAFNTIFVHRFPSICRLTVKLLDHCPSAGKELENQSDDCQHQQNVNKPAQGVAADNT
jgi:hypothetical protein